MITYRLLVAPLAVVLLLLAPGPAFAATQRDCRATVSDPQKYLADRARVVAAAEQVRRAGGDVYVTVVRSVPGADVDRYQLALERACPAWRRTTGTSGGGQRKNNLVSLVVAVEDRTTGLYYGDEFTEVLDDAWLDIQTGEINPRLRSARYDQGIAAGLQAVAREIRGGTTAGTGRSSVDSPVREPRYVQPRPDSTPVVPREALVIGVGGAATLGLAYVVTRWLLRRRRRRAELDKLRHAAISARNGAQDAFLRLEQEENGLETAAAAYTAVAGEPDPALVQEITSAQQRTSEVNRDYLAAADAWAAAPVKLDKPARAGVEDSAYLAPRRQFQALSAELTAVTTTVGSAAVRVEAARQLILSLPQDLGAAEEEISALARARTEAQAGALRTDRADAVLATASADLAAVQSVRRSGRYAQASQELLALRERVDAARQWVAGLVGRRAQAHEALAELTHAGASMNRELAECNRSIESLAQLVAAASLAQARDAARSADQALATLSETLVQIRSGLAGTVDVDAVTGRVELARSLHDDIRAFLDTAAQSLAAVEHARGATQAELAAAAEALTGAGRALAAPTDRHDLVLRMDPTALQAQVRAAQAHYDRAAAAWQERLPDVLSAIAGARSARTDAQAVIAEVAKAVERAVAVRAACTAGLAEAESAVARAAAVIQHGGWDVGALATAGYDDAVRHLRAAHDAAAPDPESSLSHARRAEAAALTATERAEADIRLAELERQRRRRSAMWAASSSRSTYASSSSSGFSGGGSSFSGGGSSGGGGGGGSSRW